jgi:hypothetical protein
MVDGFGVQGGRNKPAKSTEPVIDLYDEHIVRQNKRSAILSGSASVAESATVDVDEHRFRLTRRDSYLAINVEYKQSSLGAGMLPDAPPARKHGGAKVVACSTP